jgi:hypothetical protein
MLKINLIPTNVHCLCYSTQFLLKNARHVSNQFIVHLQGLTFLKLHQLYIHGVDLGGLVVSVLATGPKVRGFDPYRDRWIFKGDKNPEHNFLRRGSTAVGPMS